MSPTPQARARSSSPSRSGPLIPITQKLSASAATWKPARRSTRQAPTAAEPGTWGLWILVSNVAAWTVRSGGSSSRSHSRTPTDVPSGSVPAVHWRGPDADWDDEGFDDLTEIGDDLRVGALDDDRPHDDELYDFDELDEVGADDGEHEPDHVVVGSGRRVAPARPVPEAAPPTGGAGRNMGVAAAVGLGVAAVAVALLYAGPQFALLLVVAAVIGLPLAHALFGEAVALLGATLLLGFLLGRWTAR